ncbi:hypothetical protein ACH436_14335 [Isoptericola sp. NPDC019693]|uniref:hypothetical protein n=1 Tax=Isoptericola sp. NPDC019693 TaxID=3364009 RepID=UPI0037BBD798
MPTRILLARDHDPYALRSGLRAGALERVRRGAYRAVDGVEPSTATERATLARSGVVDRAHAVHAGLRTLHWFSHATAAVLHGLPVWRLPEDVHLTQHYRASSRAAADVRRHTLPVVPGQRDVAAGLPVTSLARTVADCATTLPALDGLVVADAALRRGADREEVREIVARRYRGGARGAVLVELADTGAETPWETWLRYVALWAGLPRPETQVEVVTRIGTFRVDLGWPEHGVLAEYDGLVKYRDGELAPGYRGADALVAEKRRHDAITEATGVAPFRVTSRDAGDVDDVARRLLRRFPPHVRHDARRRPPLTRPG